MAYPLEKYKYYEYKNENGGMTICAMSTYGGRPVKGLAKCDPRDEFDVEKGKKLAAARCNLKVAQKRQARASKKYLEASADFYNAQAFFDRMREYYMDSVDAVDEAAEELRNLVAEY